MTPARIWLVIQLALLVFIAWRLFADRFYSLNKFADDVERRFPWFSWERWGDKISWVHHALWTALVGSVGGVIHLVLVASFRPGFQRFALAWVIFYVVREGYGFIHDAKPLSWKRKLDGIMDVVFPALVLGASYL